MEYLFNKWQEVYDSIHESKKILLVFDYDGTLTPIVERPEVAYLPNGTKQLLQALARQRHFTLGIISGRALVDLKERVGISGMIYAGNHGLEIEGPGIKFVNPVAMELRPILRIIHYVLSRALGTIKGVLVENKELSLSIHYRLVDEHRVGEVERIIQRVVGSAQAVGKAKITSGKKVYEVRPAVTWDKGKAIKLIMKKYGKGGRRSGLLPMYFGDDLTDEDGFRAIREYGSGVSVFIGEPNRCSEAQYFLESPIEVAKFLDILLKHSQRGFK